MTCKNCGGDMCGDGYTDVRHCENLDLIGEGHEPDAGPVYCDYLGEESGHYTQPVQKEFYKSFSVGVDTEARAR